MKKVVAILLLLGTSTGGLAATPPPASGAIGVELFISTLSNINLSESSGENTPWEPEMDEVYFKVSYETSRVPLQTHREPRNDRRGHEDDYYQVRKHQTKLFNFAGWKNKHSEHVHYPRLYAGFLAPGEFMVARVLVGEWDFSFNDVKVGIDAVSSFCELVPDSGVRSACRFGRGLTTHLPVDGDDVIGAFTVRIENVDGNLNVVWLPEDRMTSDGDRPVVALVEDTDSPFVLTLEDRFDLDAQKFDMQGTNRTHYEVTAAVKVDPNVRTDAFVYQNSDSHGCDDHQQVSVQAAPLGSLEPIAQGAKKEFEVFFEGMDLNWSCGSEQRVSNLGPDKHGIAFRAKDEVKLSMFKTEPFEPDLGFAVGPLLDASEPMDRDQSVGLEDLHDMSYKLFATRFVGITPYRTYPLQREWSATACQRICANEAYCAAWTYNFPVNESNSPSCELFDSASSKDHAENAISGTKLRGVAMTQGGQHEPWELSLDTNRDLRYGSYEDYLVIRDSLGEEVPFADLDGDGVVAQRDLKLFSQWLPESQLADWSVVRPSASHEMTFVNVELETFEPYVVSSYATNAPGEVRVSRTSVGKYLVMGRFGSVMAESGANIQVSPTGRMAASCAVEEVLEISGATALFAGEGEMGGFTVQCYTHDGKPADSTFNLLVVRLDDDDDTTAYVKAGGDVQTLNSPVDATYEHSPGGDSVSTRLRAGVYIVRFDDFLEGRGGNVQVTTVGDSNSRCEVANYGDAWDKQVKVMCRDPSTKKLVDAEFYLLAIEGHAFGGKVAYLGTHGAANGLSVLHETKQVLSAHGDVSVEHVSKGTYAVNFEGIDKFETWQVSTVTGGKRFTCRTTDVRGGSISVECRYFNGKLADLEYPGFNLIGLTSKTQD